MKEDHEIIHAVDGVMALRPKIKCRELNDEQLRALKRRRDEMEYAQEIQAIERDETVIPMIHDARHFGQR